MSGTSINTLRSAGLCALLALSLAAASTAQAVKLERNLAKGATVRQSSTDLGGDAARAIDGNRDGNWLANSVTHTRMENEPYWEIDLGASYHIDELRVYGRTDCCTERLQSFHVFYRDTDQGFAFPDIDSTLSQPNTDLRPAFSVQGIKDPGTGLMVAGQAISFPIEARARHIRIQLPGVNVLSLAEVEVIARYQADGPALVANATSWVRTPIATAEATVLASDGNNLVTFFGGQDGRLSASVNFGPEASIAGAPLIGSARITAAGNRDSGHVMVGMRELARGRSAKLHILDATLSNSAIASAEWSSPGSGSGTPALAFACGQAFAAWRSGNALMVSSKPLTAGAAWSTPARIADSGSSPSLAVNASQDVAVAFLRPDRTATLYTTACAAGASSWTEAAPPPLVSFGNEVAVAAYGDMFSVAMLAGNRRAQFATQLPNAEHSWTPFEVIGNPTSETVTTPVLTVFSGVTIALLEGVDNVHRYWVRSPNTFVARDGWMGGNMIGGSKLKGSLPSLATIGNSRVSGINNAPAELFIARRSRTDGYTYVHDLGRFIAQDALLSSFGILIRGESPVPPFAHWGDIRDLPNLFEHFLALLSLPRAAWPKVTSKQCGSVFLHTEMIVPPQFGGTAHPGDCPMRLWQSRSASMGTANGTGGLQHEWMHLDYSQRGIGALPGYATIFKFGGASDVPANSGLKACASESDCGGDLCEEGGFDQGTGESNTTDFAANEIELRRWDTVKVCVSRLNGPDGRRYQGGVAWYDVGTDDHAFVDTALLYRWYGDELRAMAAADVFHGNAQLQERYNWLRDNYFGGVEYNGSASVAPPDFDRSHAYRGRPNQ